MLQYQAIPEDLLIVLKQLMQLEKLNNFFLVGGTSLALQIGHRVSVDIDLFTDKSFDHDEILNELRKSLEVRLDYSRPQGMQLTINRLKVDLFNWAVPFLKPPVIEDHIRLADVTDIAAFKLDAITGRKTKKDFYDIYFILKRMSLAEMIQGYRLKYPYNSVKNVVMALSSCSAADSDQQPQLLKNIPWEEVKTNLKKEIADYEQALIQNRQQKATEREENIRELMRRKKEQE